MQVKDKLRIMYASNAPWCNSGYGIQGRSLLPRLKKLDVVDDVALFAWYGLQGGGMMFGDIACYPAGMDAYGNDMYAAHCGHFHADVLITLIDAWVMKQQALDELAEKGVRWLPWMPVDHEPAPEAVLKNARAAHLPLTYAKHGQRMLEEAGVPNYYIPHGVEVDTFKVLPDEAVAEFRRKFCEDAAWLGVMVAANKGWPSRKGFVETLQAFKQVLPDLPKPARLYVHANYAKNTGGGDLLGLVKALDLEEHVRFPDRYKLWVGEYDQRYLALMYNAANVYLGASRGEGFGIPIVEAQACGTPVLVTRFTSMPELVRWGVAVEPASLDYTYQDSWQAVPSVPGIAQAMVDLTNERLALKPAELKAKRMAASGAIHQEFDWDVLVKDYWRPMLHGVLAGINAAKD